MTTRTSKRSRRALSRPPASATSPDDFISGAAHSDPPQSDATPQASTQSGSTTRRKEPVHIFNLRIPVSEFEHLEDWAKRVSPRDSVHALVLKAVREKLARLEQGEDTE
jgi:hypothetical protein